MVYFLFFIYALSLGATLFVFVKRTNKKVADLNLAVTDLITSNRAMLNLYDSIVKGQNLNAKAVDLIIKQCHLLTKDFYDFKDQAATGFNLIANMLDGKITLLEDRNGFCRRYK